MFKDTSEATILSILSEGKLTLQGEFLWGSNYTYLAKIESGGTTLQGVYKPTRGERPLWDFPTATLARREVAAYLLSEALNWKLVPATVYRKKGPLGPGSLQLFIEHDPEYHYFNFCEADHQRLRPVALFDLLVNNADRKGSHILIGPDSRIWLIDHGICFHVEDKLRTVVWDFAGEPLPANLCDDLVRLRDRLRLRSGGNAELVDCLRDYLSPTEIAALADRIDRLLVAGHFPNPDPNRRPYPWPPV
jgi:uncharacterized repeat protein (TIGR03843 family)